MWGDAVGLDFPVTHRTLEHVIDRVPPGRYTLVAQSPDRLRTLQQTLNVTGDVDLLEVSLTVPTGTATLSGAFLESLALAPVLFSVDNDLRVTLQARDDFYFVQGLPAGRYFIGNPYLRDKAPLIRFAIADGEHKVVDINPRDWSSPGQGLLAVLVTDSQHQPLPAAQAWLEGTDGRIDPVVRTDREQIFVAPAGSYRLHASYDGFPTQHKDVSIEANALMALYPERSLVQVRLEQP